MQYNRIILAVLFLLIFGAGAYYWNSKNPETQQDIITEREPDLSNQDLMQAQIDLTFIDNGLNQQLSEQERYDLLLKKSKVLIKLGKLKDADRPLKDAITLRPKTSNAYSDLYDLQLEMNAIDDAEETIKKIMEINPTGSYWRKYIDFNRSKLMVSNEEANEMYRQALNETGEDISVITAYARFLEETGDKNRAKEYWTIAGQRDPEDKAKYDAEISRIDGATQQTTPQSTNP